MPNPWPLVPLGDVLSKSEEWTDLQPDARYREVTVRLWGKGVTLRRETSGAEIAAKRRLVVHASQFILSRIDARNGAFGLVPPSLEGAIVSNDFPVFDPNPARVIPPFLAWMSRTPSFVEICKAASEGTTNRVRLKEDRFLGTQIPLPPLDEQRRIVARIEQLAAKIEEARHLRQETELALRRLLLGAYSKITAGAPVLRMAEVAPLVRRPVEVDLESEYLELGIRSFGNGTFHKAPVTGAALGTKRIFKIETGDLLFNIVFAWEGAVAVAKKEDHGRVGSHRFLTCVSKRGVATPDYLCFHLLTEQGLEDLGKASPGGAGRNRTLGLEALAAISVPVPSFDKLLWYGDLQAKVDALKRLQAETAAELDALLPSILDRAFRGENFKRT